MKEVVREEKVEVRQILDNQRKKIDSNKGDYRQECDDKYSRTLHLSSPLLYCLLLFINLTVVVCSISGVLVSPGCRASITFFVFPPTGKHTIVTL